MKEKLKPIQQEVELPEGVEVEIEGNKVKFRKQDKEVEKVLPGVLIEKKENKLIVRTTRSTKREVKQVNTILSHIRNLILGLEEDFFYKLQICSVHFPMNISVKENFVIVKNFLGETKERKAKILEGVEVKIDKDIIIVSSANKELAGQTAANIEKTTRTKTKDRRIFQDGIFMIERAGKKI